MVQIHFLNVGHGDCTVIRHATGRLTVIDINNGNDVDSTTAREIATALPPQYPSLDTQLLAAALYGGRRLDALAAAGYGTRLVNPVDFLQQTYPRQSIFRYVQSHPDLDHMRGLAALRAAGIRITNFWDTCHEKVPEFQNDADRRDWDEYGHLRNGVNGTTVLQLRRGVQGVYYNQEPEGVTGGDRLTILSPTVELEAEAQRSDDYNKLSYVLLFEHQGVRIIFGGDADEDAWESILSACGGAIACNVLKASHHGRDTGFHQAAVKAMNPEYVVVSVGKKPTSDASNKYRNLGAQVWSTRWKGTITVAIDDSGQGRITPEVDR